MSKADFKQKNMYSVSPVQKRLYLLNQIEEEKLQNNHTHAFHIQGSLRQDRIKEAVHTLLNRHEALRTSFHVIEGKVVKQIHEQVELVIEYRETSIELVNKTIKEIASTYQLGVPPLLKVSILSMGEQQHLLLLNIHDIIADHASGNLILKEIVSLYLGDPLLDDATHLKRQEIHLNKERLQEQKTYWLNQFHGEIPLLDLPLDYHRPSTQSFDGEAIHFSLSTEMTKQLKELALKEHTNLEVILLSIYQVLLSKTTRQSDMIVGLVHSNGLENTVGNHEQPYALRNQVEKQLAFTTFLHQIKEKLFVARENLDYPFEQVIDQVQVTREINRNPLYDAMFVMKKQELEKIEQNDMIFSPYELSHRAAKVDLTLEVKEVDNKIECTFLYSLPLFLRSTIERMGTHFVQLTKQIIQQKKVTIAELHLISEREKEQIINDFNPSTTDYPINKTIPQQFEEQVGRTPKDIALICGEKRLSYTELNEQANQLAHYLIDKQKVGKDSLVGIVMERSTEMMVTILAILKTGGAYVPIDPAFPSDRIKAIIEDAKIKTVLTSEENLLLMNRLQQDCKHPFIPVTFNSDLYVEFVEYEKKSPQLSFSVNDLAYVIYTSGSTGTPKGVMVEHQALSNFVQAMADEIDFKYGKTILSLTTVSFDIFFMEAILPMLKGLRVILAEEVEQKDSKLISSLIQEHHVDMLQTTPSRMKVIINDEQGLAAISNLKEIMLGGEALSDALLVELQNHTVARIYNLYGPTESTIWSTMKDLTDKEKVDIGQPIANTQVYILDEHLSLQPIGVTGEICIAGDGLARGYLNNSKLTKQKFVENPFQQGKKMYKTGDMARFLDDGSIEYLGRMDHQVKIRGYRIELGEIEHHLQKHSAVKEAAVIAQKNTSEQDELCAYLVSSSELSVSEIRSYLQQKLPEYMLPSYFVQLESMPVTINGKLDLNKLPEPDHSMKIGTEYRAPNNPIEEALVPIWKHILNVEDIGVMDNFFDLGGNSIQATILVSKIHEMMQVEVPLKEVFSAPTIKQLANVIMLYTAIGHITDEPYMLMSEPREKNLFCFPPIIGYGVLFGGIVPFIESHSIYAFDFIEEESRMEEYINMITKIQPDGDYVLLGYSTGGILAFEVAKEMEKKGLVVSDIILLDADKRNHRVDQSPAEIVRELELIMHENKVHAQYAKDMFNKRAIIFKTYLNHLVSDVLVNANIHFITSIETDKELLKTWEGATNGEHFIYQGFGAHNTMLSLETVTENSLVIREILDRL
ncbi:non-ribosomal peptide synthetase [Bacillus carboniphilus]|uniref:Non-ribosomal peptide synthetase n=1 Tax=Bacillus carboniphilus TaxID=86663 RepID=A0ABY9JWQ0_9BACI|nr:non-ribosomal peptide synthetase [Bacillus carboniphilus]WLR43821.1 non-ribosomal peptide synthetase [Bacillus carboniphilus]